MRIAIYEDNDEHSQRLTRLIKQWSESTNTEIALFTFNSVFEAADTTAFDCILLDVEMPGMNGIEFAHELRQNGINAPIVFVSSHTEYGLDGYEVDALRFLDKSDPRFETKLTECMDRIAFEIKNSINAFYRITTERKLISIPMREITYFEMNNHDLTIHTMTGVFSERKTFAQIKQELPIQFVQIGKSLIINVLQLVQVTKSQAVLHDGSVLPVSPKYSAELFRSFSEMM